MNFRFVPTYFFLNLVEDLSRIIVKDIYNNATFKVILLGVLNG